MTAANLFQRFRQHRAFETVEELIGSLDEELGTRDRYGAKATSEVESILTDLTFDSLNRDYETTHGTSHIATYRFERPEVRVWVCSTFHSQTEEYQNTLITVTLRDEETESFSFTVGKAGNVVPDD